MLLDAAGHTNANTQNHPLLFWKRWLMHADKRGHAEGPQFWIRIAH